MGKESGIEALAAVARAGGGAFAVEPVQVGPVKAGEVLVRIVASGVCHTDLVARDGGYPVPLPAVLGHEGSGVVAAVGPGVARVAPGDHVVLSFASCGGCEPCITGRPFACERFPELNFGGVMVDSTHRLYQGQVPLSTFFGQSSFATYAAVNEAGVVKVDADIDLTLLGPLGCGIQTGAGTVMNFLRPEAGYGIAVFGCGTVGLSAVMAARAVGCDPVIAVDRHSARLAMARQLGATHAVEASRDDVAEEIRRVCRGGVRYAVEAAGVPAAVRQAFQALGALGSLAVVGAPPFGTEVSLDINDFLSGNKSVTGVVEGGGPPRVFIPRLIALYRRGLFPFDRLFTFYDFRDINQAVADSLAGKTIKPVLRMDG